MNCLPLANISSNEGKETIRRWKNLFVFGDMSLGEAIKKRRDTRTRNVNVVSIEWRQSDRLSRDSHSRRESWRRSVLDRQLTFWLFPRQASSLNLGEENSIWNEPIDQPSPRSKVRSSLLIRDKKMKLWWRDTEKKMNNKIPICIRGDEHRSPADHMERRFCLKNKETSSGEMTWSDDRGAKEENGNKS